MAAGCASDAQWRAGDFRPIVDCLRMAPAQRLADVYTPQTRGGLAYWHMVIDGPGGIWPDFLENLGRLRPNVPVLTGSNDDEYTWTLFVQGALRTGRLTLPDMNRWDSLGWITYEHEIVINRNIEYRSSFFSDCKAPTSFEKLVNVSLRRQTIHSQQAAFNNNVLLNIQGHRKDQRTLIERSAM